MLAQLKELNTENLKWCNKCSHYVTISLQRKTNLKYQIKTFCLNH